MVLETLDASAPGYDPTQGGEAAYIPFGYHADFIDYLADKPQLFQVITYDDLMWGEDYDHARGYPQEQLAWKVALEQGRLDSQKIYVLLQHDVDTRPERTLHLLRYEESRGIRSNAMIFHRRVNRRKLASTGELEFTPYDLDFDLLRRLQRDGFVIGYHSNALEQARFDFQRAQEIFCHDVEVLREELDIRYFSAHGGTPGPTRENNLDVPLPDKLAGTLRWVHNGGTPKFKQNYSDGGINSPRRDPAKRDLRDFVRTWRRGQRYRVLTHPQYYHDPCGTSPRMAGTPWYEDVRKAYRSGNSAYVWSGVEVEGSAKPAPLAERMWNRLKSGRWR